MHQKLAVKITSVQLSCGLECDDVKITRSWSVLHCLNQDPPDHAWTRHVTSCTGMSVYHCHQSTTGGRRSSSSYYHVILTYRTLS